jgi:hypothetical protein
MKSISVLEDQIEKELFELNQIQGLIKNIHQHQHPPEYHSDDHQGLSPARQIAMPVQHRQNKTPKPLDRHPRGGSPSDEFERPRGSYQQDLRGKQARQAQAPGLNSRTGIELSKSPIAKKPDEKRRIVIKEDKENQRANNHPFDCWQNGSPLKNSSQKEKKLAANYQGKQKEPRTPLKTSKQGKEIDSIRHQLGLNLDSDNCPSNPFADPISFLEENSKMLIP